MSHARLFAVVALLCSIGLMLAACSGTTAPQIPATTVASPTEPATPKQAPDANKVTVWTHSGTAEEAEALTQILENFRAQRPDIHVDLVHVPQDT
jgi:ABC-type glycerol-3-phosphate transport system substrate-binding protein